MATPITYQLDVLGGMQFENLVQELLLAELGLGVEVWGGSSDRGKDAYSFSKLNFPNRHKTSQGPFIFQAKFIAGANAAGARFEKGLTAAVQDEIEQIRKRIELKKWRFPRHYGLFTNAPITVGQRDKVRALFSKILPKSTVTIHGATAICGLLDSNISIARAFPQLLSLRSLSDLLSSVVRNKSIQRSESVIKEAEALTKVFVPTNAYDRAWRVLSKHYFVVLEGPPEMGKTAIAWMVSAVQLTQKWEAIDCDSPDDFFENYSPQEKQIFVADDAFGTTEYEAARGSIWGRHLHKILPKLNSTHWLVWTSRMNILKKALQEMSLQGKAASFPKPAEVIVNAGSIDRRERAMILYRHARAVGLDESAKEIIRKNAASVVDNEHFTPERIRRFVNEELPNLKPKSRSGGLSESDISDEIDRAIENPTDRMKKSYGKLEQQHKWLLITLLDCDRGPEIPEMESAYRRFLTPNKPIEEEIQLLEEGFLQKSSESGETLIDWIHPSYRDLVIQELQTDEGMAEHFLESCSIRGLRLAISIAGGSTGEKRFPLMATPKSWEILQRRSLNLIKESSDEYTGWDVLRMLQNAARSANDVPIIHDQIVAMLKDCCIAIKERLDEINGAISSFILKQMFEATMILRPPAPMPSLFKTWTEIESAFEKVVDAAPEELLDSTTVSDWATLVGIVSKCDQRLLIQSGFPEDFATKFNILYSLIESELSDGPSLGDEDDYANEISRLGELSSGLNNLVGIIPGVDRKLKQLTRRLSERIGNLEEDQSQFQENADLMEPALSDEHRHKESFDIDRLFSDL